ncbi:sulfite exporter TauE/SafE family protein [Poriferisphaera sp. WC338]|uniref:sulfite exporter TauE/SafE family protein n=1 Tax=Poriferisphaera sp. WC338 TaxID=3425129 RepID=UPI003D8158AB
MPDYILYILLAITGLIAGFVNTLAGGGSFLTIPALIYFFNLPPQIANATNRFSVIFYAGTSSSIFLKHGLTDYRLMLRLLIPSIVGAVCGAGAAAILPPKSFQLIFGIAMILMALTFILKPKILLETRHRTKPTPIKELFVFYLIGFYGGFMQAGVGLLLLAGIAIFHAKDLVKSNAIKVTLAFFFGFVSVAIFAYYGQIDYVKGAVIAIGAIIGALIGAKLAIKKGARLIFFFVITIAIITGINLIYTTFTTS